MNNSITKGLLVGLAALAFQTTAATKTVVLQDGQNGYTGISDMFWSNTDGVTRNYPAEGAYNAVTLPKIHVSSGG